MRYTKIVNHLTNNELRIRYEQSSDPKIRKRWHLLWLVQEKGLTVTYASEIVGQG